MLFLHIHCRPIDHCPLLCTCGCKARRAGGQTVSGHFTIDGARLDASLFAPPHPIQPSQRHSLLASSWCVVSRRTPCRTQKSPAAACVCRNYYAHTEGGVPTAHMYWQCEDAVQVKFSITDLHVILWATAAASGDCIRVAMCTCVSSALALLVGDPFPLQSYQSHDFHIHTNCVHNNMPEQHGRASRNPRRAWQAIEVERSGFRARVPKLCETGLASGVAFNLADPP